MNWTKPESEPPAICPVCKAAIVASTSKDFRTYECGQAWLSQTGFITDWDNPPRVRADGLAWKE